VLQRIAANNYIETLQQMCRRFFNVADVYLMIPAGQGRFRFLAIDVYSDISGPTYLRCGEERLLAATDVRDDSTQLGQQTSAKNQFVVTPSAEPALDRPADSPVRREERRKTAF
jgi:hypothetical protein